MPLSPTSSHLSGSLLLGSRLGDNTNLQQLQLQQQQQQQQMQQQQHLQQLQQNNINHLGMTNNMSMQNSTTTQQQQLLSQQQQQQQQQHNDGTKSAGTITGMLADFSRALGNIHQSSLKNTSEAFENPRTTFKESQASPQDPWRNSQIILEISKNYFVIFRVSSRILKVLQ